MAQLIAANQIKKQEDMFVLGTYDRMPFVLTHGDGMKLFDTEQKEYLDFGSGIAVNALGHSHPAVVKAIKEQSELLSHVSNLYHTAPHAALAEKLCQSSFADKVFFSNSGAEAVEAALKFARKYSRQHFGDECVEIVAFEGGFHGRTFGALSVTARQKYQDPFKPLLQDVKILPFNDVDAVKQGITTRTAAVIIEPVQGEGGITVASPEFLQVIREQCDQYGAQLIFDEIQTGVGRTGHLWAHEMQTIQPDIMTTAKALGGGLPIGATLLKSHVADAIEPGDHGSTFGGGPVVAAAALAVINEVTRPEMLKHIHEMGTYLVQSVESLGLPGVVEIRGKGLMIGVEFDTPVGDIVLKAADKGVLVLSAGPNVLRLLPPYIVQKAHIDQLINVLAEIL